MDVAHNALKLPESLSGLNFLRQTFFVFPHPRQWCCSVREEGGEWDEEEDSLTGCSWTMTINDSQSVAERAIPVKGSTTGKDAQSYRKEKADCSLSEGMMEDEYVLSPGVRYSLMVENRKACYRLKQQCIFHNTCTWLQCILLTLIIHWATLWYN